MSFSKKSDIHIQVENALENIRPYLITDGGNIRVVEITDNHDVFLEFMGNCHHCPMSNTTFKIGVEQTIKNCVPEINTIKIVNTENA